MELESFLFTNFVPTSTDVIREHISSFAGNANQMTAVGIGFLAAIALLLIRNVDATLNRIWRIKKKRPMMISFAVYWMVLSLGPVLLGASIGVTSYIVSLVSFADQGIPGFSGFLLKLLPYGISMVGFIMLYTLVPNTRVSFRAAIPGAFFAALLFELTKKGFASKESNDTLISQVAVAHADVKAAQAALVSRERNVDAALASQAEIQTQIDDAVLSAPSIGRVLYRLAEPGEVIGSGGKVMTLVNLSDVYMELYLPSSQVNRVAIGAQARIKLDILEAAIPATVSFVSPESQFTPKEVETASERDKLMFRVKVRVPQTLVLKHINQVKTGIRGVAYVQLTPLPGEEIGPWPEFLQTLAQ